MKAPIEDLTPLLIAIQQNLDGELHLDELSAAHGYSPYHFHRVFKERVGETPKKYVERLRMEKAAYKLWITGESVIGVGLSVGFQNHETFTRAFRRFFGVTPREFRADGRIRKQRHLEAQRSWRPQDCVLSAVRFETRRPMALLSKRHLGDYMEIPEAFSDKDDLWTPLIAQAERRRIAYQPIALAIFYDNPWLTPKNAQRTDICLPIASPVSHVGGLQCIRFEGGLFGVIEHMGPYETLRHAFRRLADSIHESKLYRHPEEPTGVISVRPRIGNAAVRSEVWMPVVKVEKTQSKKG